LTGEIKRENEFYPKNCGEMFAHHQSKKDMVIWGTHGTSESRALMIFEKGFISSLLKDCSDSLQWLGTGIYFFDNNVEAAEGWAKFRAQQDVPESNPVVLTATLACSQERFFDLDCLKHLTLYKKFYKLVENDAANHVKKDDKIDGLVLEVLCKEMNVAMIRASLNTIDEFPLQPIEKYSRIICGMQVQICVRDGQCIKALESMEIQVNELIC